MPEFRLPDLGEGVTEAEVDRWLVKEGQEVAEDDLLVEVITDKATAEIPSPFAGVVARLHVAEGDIVPVGTVLITINDSNSSSPAGPATVSEDESNSSSPAVLEAVGEEKNVLAMPPVRKLARELGVDIEKVTGSGPGGRVTRADVEGRADRAPGSQSVEGAGRRVPLRGIRRKIAEHMVTAHVTIPPVTHVEECDVTELDAARKFAAERASGETKLTFLPFIVKAVAIGLRDHPELNSSLDEDAQEIVLHDRCDIGIAVDTPQGLMVPVVRSVDTKSLTSIAADIERLATAARTGTIEASDLHGSTFSITSPGPLSGLLATPIVNHPEAAILGVHRAVERPVVRNGQIVVRLMMNLSITFDHRLVDGAPAARFLKDVVGMLEHPAVLAIDAGRP